LDVGVCWGLHSSSSASSERPDLTVGLFHIACVFFDNLVKSLLVDRSKYQSSTAHDRNSSKPRRQISPMARIRAYPLPWEQNKGCQRLGRPDDTEQNARYHVSIVSPETFPKCSLSEVSTASPYVSAMLAIIVSASLMGVPLRRSLVTSLPYLSQASTQKSRNA
jgi:hypothetical protein